MNNILAHIAGPSGCGKTELANLLSWYVGNIHLIDLDIFDEDAYTYTLGNQEKNDYTDDQLLEHHKVKQRLVDHFIRTHEEPIIFFGHIEEAGNVLNFTAKFKLLLTNIISGAIHRGKHHNLSNGEITDLIRVGRKDVTFYLDRGYTASTSREIYTTILRWSKELMGKGGV